MSQFAKEKKKMKRALRKQIGKKKYKEVYGNIISFTPWKVEVLFGSVYSRVPDDDDDDDLNLDSSCPNCGTEYDQIDYEYQRCHICKYDNDHKI
jgi:hypothetical protein